MAPRRSPQNGLRPVRHRRRNARDRQLRTEQQLHVYEEELRIQNDSLRSAQADLEAVRDSFIELYDFAPNGYMTLDPQGVIIQLNLTAAAWLGRRKQAVEGLPLLGFVRKEDRAAIIDFLQRCRHAASASVNVTVEVSLKGSDGERDVQLLSRGRVDRNGQRQQFTAMVDIGDQKRIASERELIAQAQAALTSQLVAAQEEERHRISRELHDNIGQQLTALRLTLEAVATATAQRKDHRPQIARAREIIRQLDQAVDFIAADLRPAALDVGLDEASREFVTTWSTTFKIPTVFASDPMDGLLLSATARAHLYRIVQEALNNIHKHAGCTKASVLLRRRHEMLQLIVEDNGRGFQSEPGRPRSRSGFGLLGMRERAELVHATLAIRSRVGRGTRVSVVVFDAFKGPRPRRTRARAGR